MCSFIWESWSSLLDCGVLESFCVNFFVVNIDLFLDSILVGVLINIISINEFIIWFNWYIDGEFISIDEVFEYIFEEGIYILFFWGEGSSFFCLIVFDICILMVYCLI